MKKKALTALIGILCLYCLDGYGQTAKQILKARFDSCQSRIFTFPNPEDNIQCAYKEIEIGKQLNDNDVIIQAHIDLGRAFFQIKNYNLALQNAHKALFLLKKSGTEKQKANINRLTGAIYSSLDNLPLAEKYLQEAYLYHLHAKDTVDMIVVLGEIAILQGRKKNYEACISSFNDIYQLARKQNRENICIVSLLNLAWTYRMMDQFDLGLNTLERILLQFPDSLLQRKKYQINLLITRGEILFQKGRIEEAEADFIQGLSLAESIYDYNARITLLRNLAEIGSKRQDFPLVAECYEKITQYQDSLAKNADFWRIAETEFSYDLEQKNRQIEEMGMRMKTTKILWINFIIIIILCTLFLYWRHRIREQISRKKTEQLNRERKIETDMMTDLSIYFHEFKGSIDDIIKILQKTSLRVHTDKEKKAIRQCAYRLSEIVSENKMALNNFTDTRYGDFLQRLSLKYPDLTTVEKRICAMLMAGFSSKDMAGVLNCSDGSLNNIRSKIRKKIAVRPGKSILSTLKSI